LRFEVGLAGFTKALAKELDGTGVSVTAVLPGSTDTDMLRGSGFEPQLAADEVAGCWRSSPGSLRSP